MKFKKLWLAAIAVVLPIFLTVPAVYATSGYTWAQKLDGTAVSQTFVSIASSASGKNLAAVGSGGDIYTSNDYGANWTDVTINTPASGQTWTNISMSASGRYETALAANGDIWHSQDYGATWTNETAGTASSGSNWLHSATSSTGQYVVAANYHDIFISSDYGVHWTNETGGTTLSGLQWSAMSISASGQYIYIIEDTLAIYGSSDYGANWTKLADKPSLITSGWNVITASADGQHVVAGDFQGDLYRSSNYGANWTDVTGGTAASGLYWNGLSSSATGQYLVATSNDASGTDPTPVYISRDYGSTWTNITGGTSLETTYWVSIAMSASGERIAAAANDFGIYTADDPSLRPPAPVIANQNITTTVSAGSSVTVNVLGGVSGYDPNTLAIVSGPTNGTAVDPPGDITYTPNKGYVGTDLLTYQLCAPLDDTVCTQATLTFKVMAAPDTGFGAPVNHPRAPLVAFGLAAISLASFGIGMRKLH